MKPLNFNFSNEFVIITPDGQKKPFSNVFDSLRLLDYEEKLAKDSSLSKIFYLCNLDADVDFNTYELVLKNGTRRSIEKKTIEEG